MTTTTPRTRSNAFLLAGAPPVAPGGQLGMFDGATPDPAGAVWLAFTGDHDEADAARRFEARYGQPPRYVRDGLGGLLLAGPVPSEVQP